LNSILLHKKPGKVSGEIFISGSKSESNRLLILNHLFDNKINIENLSDAEDTRLLQKALQSNSVEIDIHHAGTAMRFLAAYLAIQENRETILTGSERMKQRPIGILVNALNLLGAEISFLEKNGFPPLQIKGKKITKSFVELDAGISSQFITALMLIAPKLENGLKIKLNRKATSLPYLAMTAEIMKKLGIKIEQNQGEFHIFPKTELGSHKFVVESDWSSASYFYSLAALSETAEIKIHSFSKDSLQGDSEVVNIYRDCFGVNTKFEENTVILIKNPDRELKPVRIDLNGTPDIAQTIAVTCVGLKIKCVLTGLSTLKIKETDRLAALKNELKKIGALSKITDDSLEITGFREPDRIPVIKTYGDHRMVMSFAPFCLLSDLEIENPEVTDKSYPAFWEDFFRIVEEN